MVISAIPGGGHEAHAGRLPIRSLPALIRFRRETSAGRVALITRERSWTYRDLDEASSRAAQGLAAVGVTRGDCLACLTKHGAISLTLLFAASKLGAILAPLNWRLSTRELEYVIGVARPKALVADSILSSGLREVSAPGILRTVIEDDFTAIERIASWAREPALLETDAQTDPNAAIVRLFSSGTTGPPKAIDLSHRGVLTHCREWTAPYGYLGHATVYLNVLPTFHVAGITCAVWMVSLGGCSVFYPQFDAREFLEAIPRHRVTDTFVVPTMLRSLVDAPESATTNLSSLRSIGYGGSPIDEALLTRCLERFKCRFVQAYGMTECSGTVTLLSAQDHDPCGPRKRLLRSAGRPAPHVEIRIVEPVSARACAEGEVGEAWIRSEQNMVGYFANPQATAEAFPEGRDERGGWYRSGDAGYMLGGYLYLQDRIRDMIISGGENIYPVEIEAIIATHPAVAEVAVIGVPHEKWGETPKACVVLNGKSEITESELIEFTRTRLAHYKCPTSIDFVDALPRNPSGKVLKRLLREPFWASRSRLIG